MREIKFLAYVNNPIHGKGVFPVKSIHFDPFVCEIVMGDEIVNFFDFDDIALLEYTGLKDKNGKEIYEGDIVRYKSFFSSDYVLGVVEYTEQAEWAVDMRLLSRIYSNVEVIGNRYTHPHLLGGEEE